MKKLFAILAVMGVLTLGSVQPVMAQDAAPAQTEQTTEAAVVEEGGGLHKELKTKFIEGDASFMSLVAIALVLGLAFCIERIIYLSLAETNTKKLMANIEAALEKGDVEAAKTVCRNTRGPVASICYQGLMRIDEGIDVVERSVVSYGGVQAGYLEKGCSWITLFIAMAPSLGFLGTVIGMVMAFDKIQQAGDISPTVVAGGMKVALITTIFGLVVALILQVFYNYILSKIEGLTSEMEDSSITLLDMAKLSYKVSYYIMYICFALILVVLGMFYFVGYNNPVGEYNAPEHTETLIYLMYAMFGICVAVTVIGAIAQFGAALRDNPKSAIKSLIGLVLFVVVLVVSYGMGSDSPVVLADGSAYTDTGWLKITDMLIYSIYFLFGVAAIGTLVNLSGIFKR